MLCFLVNSLPDIDGSVHVIFKSKVQKRLSLERPITKIDILGIAIVIGWELNIYLGIKGKLCFLVDIYFLLETQEKPNRLHLNSGKLIASMSQKERILNLMHQYTRRWKIFSPEVPALPDLKELRGMSPQAAREWKAER